MDATADEQHERFLTGAVEAGEVWGLMTGDQGWASAPSGETDQTVIPFWSDRAGAARCASEEWAEYAPTPIELAVFLTEWLPGLADEGFLAGTNWNADLVGAEVEPQTLREELEARLAAG